MDELLRKDDLGNKEKDAIRRENLQWICRKMKWHLFHILTLMLAKDGTDLNSRDKQGMTPTIQLHRFYNKEDLLEILELLINKDSGVKTVD